jgi:hypothetical protein
MNRKLLIDSLGWGVLLWLIGYILGILFFFVMPASLIGWVVMPIGILITLWVLLTRIKNNTFQHYLWLGIVWALIAIGLDYIFIIKLLNPADGYYKLDVYLYYGLTFLLPLLVGWLKSTGRIK